MTARHLCAALAALFLSFLPDYALSGPKVQIRDDQRSGVISGASFVTNYTEVTEHYVELDPPEWYSDEDYPDDETQVPEGWPTNWVEILENWRWGEYVYATNCITAPWAGSNETWTAERGFSPHYWPSTNGLARLGPDGIRALYGRYELARAHPRVWDAVYAWRNTSQPAAYGSVSEGKYANLYGGRHEDDTGLGVVVVDTEPGARVVCNMAKDGAPVPVDDVVYYDGMVAFEPFAAGESNRPVDVITEDAQVAVYMQDRPGSEVPYLYVVARDWVTGAVRHYAVGNRYYRYGLEARTEYGGRTFYCGRLTICAMRTVYADSRDPAVPGIAVFVGGSPVYYYENPYLTPPPATLVWGHVRSDLGFTVDAQHVGPGGAGERDWDGHLLVFRPLNADSATFTLSGLSYSGSFRLGAYTVSRANPLSTVWLWPGWTDAMRELYVGGSSVDAAAATVVSYDNLGNVESAAQPFPIRWSGANGWADESYTVTAGGGCSVTLDESCFRHGRVYLDSADGLTDEDWAELEANGLPHVESRTGPYYANVADAMTHAAYLGGKATLIANPESGFDITGLSTGVRLALADRSLATNVTVSGTGPDASFTLEGGRVRGTVRLADVAALVTAIVDGCVVADNVSQLDIRSHLDGKSIDNILFDYVLLATNSNIAIGDGYYRGRMQTVGGSLRVTAGDFAPGVVATGASPVSLTGGFFPSVGLYDCDVQEFSPNSCDTLTVSNSPAVTVAHTTGYGGGVGVVRAFDVGELRISTALDALEAYRVGVMTIDPGVSVSSAVLCDTPFAVTNGSFATLVIINNTVATIGGSASVTGNALLSAPAVVVGGGELASATCGGCTSVVVSNATITAATLGDCGTVAVSNATLRTASLERCGSVDLYAVVADNDPGIVAVGCDVSAHTGAVRRLEVRDGSLSIYDVELAGSGWPAASDSGIVVSNSPVVVHSGMLAYANQGWTTDAGWRFGAFDAYDSPVTVLGGEFGWLRTTGATSVELRDAYFHQGVNISGATTVVVSNCTIGETGNKRLYMQVGGSSITATESVAISGSPEVKVFALSPTITAPVVTISGGVYGEMTLSSPNATIIDGTFEEDIILSPKISAGGHRVTVHGGKFRTGCYYNDVSGTGRLQLASGKKFVRVGDYYEVQNQ